MMNPLLFFTKAGSDHHLSITRCLAILNYFFSCNPYLDVK